MESPRGGAGIGRHMNAPSDRMFASLTIHWRKCGQSDHLLTLSTTSVDGAICLDVESVALLSADKSCLTVNQFTGGINVHAGIFWRISWTIAGCCAAIWLDPPGSDSWWFPQHWLMEHNWLWFELTTDFILASRWNRIPPQLKEDEEREYLLKKKRTDRLL